MIEKTSRRNTSTAHGTSLKLTAVGGISLRLIQSASADAAMPIGRSEGFQVAIMSQVARKMANREANALINDARTDIGWLTSQLCWIRLASRLISGNAHDLYACGVATFIRPCEWILTARNKSQRLRYLELPVGVFIYLITQARGMAERNAQQAQAARHELRRAVGFSVADDILDLGQLKKVGLISKDKFVRPRAKLIR
jgi:hypothetical protein